MSPPSVGYFELLRRRPGYRYIWLGAVVSLAGDWFSLIAIYSLLQEYTGSGEAVGLMLAVRFLPAALFGPLTGVVADRFSRRKVMLVCDVLRAGVMSSMLWVRGPDDVWLVYAVTFVQMTLSAFFDPAEQASIGSVVEPDEIVTANTLHGSTWSAMLSVGATLGGWVTAKVGRDAAFVIDACSYLVSAAMILRAPIPLVKQSDSGVGRPILRQAAIDLRAGLQHLRDNPRVRRVLWVKAGWGIAGGGAILLYALMGERVFSTDPKSGAAAIGVLLGMRGVGALLGPLVARHFGGDDASWLQRAISIAFGVIIVSWLLFSAAPTLALAAAALTLAHTGVATQWVFSSSLINLWVPNEMRGRVFAFDFMAYTLVLAISSWLTGRLLDTTGWHPRWMMAALALILIFPMLVWIWSAAKVAPQKDQVSTPS